MCRDLGKFKSEEVKAWTNLRKEVITSWKYILAIYILNFSDDPPNTSSERSYQY
jgi:hypothetical protein